MTEWERAALELESTVRELVSAFQAAVVKASEDYEAGLLKAQEKYESIIMAAAPSAATPDREYDIRRRANGRRVKKTEAAAPAWDDFLNLQEHQNGSV